MTSTLTSRTENFVDGDHSRIAIVYKNGKYEDLKCAVWSSSDNIGVIKRSTVTFTINEVEHSSGVDIVYLYGCGNTYKGKSGTADIENITIKLIDADYSVDYFNSYSKSNITLSKPIKDVAIGFYQYSVATDSTELYKGTMNISGTKEIIVTYSGSATNVTATVSGGTLNSAIYYTNACKLTIAASGNVSVTVTGNSLESAKTEISIYNSDSGETVSVDNMLITDLDRASVIGEWIRSFYNNRKTLSSSWRADPRLDALDIVDNENDYGTSKVLMTEVKYDYNGAFKGSGEGKVI
jgi:hypothetical protein